MGVTVLIGTGLECAKLGLSGYIKLERHVKLLEFEQVSLLMRDYIVRLKPLDEEDVDIFLRHPAIRGQLKMLMGTPGLLHTASLALRSLIREGVPSTDEEIRCALSSHLQLHCACLCLSTILEMAFDVQ